MSEQHCCDCRYFLQHYILEKGKFMRVYCGHCTYLKVRRKKPGTVACESFVLGASQEEEFVSKEYLTKELLHYMLSLELLPEVDSEG